MFSKSLDEPAAAETRGPLRFVTTNDLSRRGISFSRMHLRRLEDAGRFPRRVHLGENRIAWLEAEIDEWVAERLAERENPPARRRRGRHAPTKERVT
jgi:prophage regulatory protein